MYLWTWFEDLLAWSDRVIDGVAVQVSPSDLLAWAQITGNVVSVEEYAILRDMSAAWAEAMNVELQYSRALKADRDRLAQGQG